MIARLEELLRLAQDEPRVAGERLVALAPELVAEVRRLQEQVAATERRCISLSQTGDGIAKERDAAQADAATLRVRLAALRCLIAEARHNLKTEHRTIPDHVTAQRATVQSDPDCPCAACLLERALALRAAAQEPTRVPDQPPPVSCAHGTNPAGDCEYVGCFNRDPFSTTRRGR